MKKILIPPFLFAMILLSCSSGKKTGSGGNSTPDTAFSAGKNAEDGLSYSTAVIIREKTESKGVDAEYAWLRKQYPGYRFQGQSLKGSGKKNYDVIDIQTAEGKPLSIYFDISNFFGKF